MNDQNPKNQATDKNPSDAAKARRLAFLLVQSVMPQEQKEAWMDLLPIMTPEQVDMLMSILEKEHQGYQESSKQLLEDLKNLEASFKQEVEKLKAEEKELIDAFIKKEINKHSKTDETNS